VELYLHCKCPGKCEPLKFDHTHRGCHPEFLKEFVDMHNGRVFAEVCEEFLQQLLEAKPEFLSNLFEPEKGLAAVFLCDWGIHRSVAALFLLLTCLYRENWRVQGEWFQLSRNFRSRQKCPWIDCDLCHLLMRDHQGDLYDHALEIYNNVYERVCLDR